MDHIHSDAEERERVSVPPPTPGPWAGGPDHVTERRAAGAEAGGGRRPRVVAQASAPHFPEGRLFGSPTLAELPPDRLVDVSLLRDYLGFAARALGRHFVIAGATFLLVFGAIWTLATMWPKTYQIDGRLLVQRNDMMASLVNPGRVVPREALAQTRAAEEIVRGRESLLAIVRETNLVEEWDRTRTPLLRFKDLLLAELSGAPTEEERVDALIGFIESRLQVFVDDAGGVVGFVLRWPDPQIAYQIVDKAMRRFLEYRRVSETSSISDSIAILEQSVEALDAQVATTIAQLPRRGPGLAASALARKAAPVPVSPAPPLPMGPPPETMVRLARLKSALESRQQELARLDGARAEQLAEAQGQLSAARTIYTEGHPTVLALRGTVGQLSQETPEMSGARRDARNLEAEYDALSTRVRIETETAEQARAMMSAQNAATQAAAPSPAPAPLDVSGMFTSDVAEPISLRLKVEIAELSAARERVNAARAELSSAQAGFKYQYSVLRPPQIPRRPVGPNLPVILVAGAIGSLLLALALAVRADLASGVLVEAWQLERQVGAPVSMRISAQP